MGQSQLARMVQPLSDPSLTVLMEEDLQLVRMGALQHGAMEVEGEGVPRLPGFAVMDLPRSLTETSPLHHVLVEGLYVMLLHSAKQNSFGL